MSDIITHFHQGDENFTIVPYSFFQITYLKPDEKYLLMWIKSRPPGYKINTKGLATHLNVGADVIKRMSKNLQVNNHLIIKRLSTGQTEWHFYQNPEHCLAAKKPKVENPPVENPHEDNPPVLTSIDPLTNIDPKKDISSSNAEHTKNQFLELWKAWPNSKNKIRSHSAFNTKMKGKSPNAITQTVNCYKNDIQGRLLAQQLGFSNMMLSTYLNNERYNDDITGPVVESEDGRIQSDRKSKELFGIKRM